MALWRSTKRREDIFGHGAYRFRKKCMMIDEFQEKYCGGL